MRPPSLAPSPYPSPLLPTRLDHLNSNEVGESDRSSVGALKALGSTETLKKAGDELLLSSCESAKTICDSKSDSKGAGEGALRTPSISVEEERDDTAEVDSLADGSVGVAESEDRLDWATEETPRRPDSLKGIQSFQRSHSNLASLGLAFPAQNGSLAISRWPSAADRGSMPEDWESYTYSPGYERVHSKTVSNDRYTAWKLFQNINASTKGDSNDFCICVSIMTDHYVLLKKKKKKMFCHVYRVPISHFL